MSFSNPYFNKGTLPVDSDMFFGREKEMRRIENFLAPDNPQCVSIVGERRIGKSSLANRVFSKIKREEKNLTVYLDCDSLPGTCSSKEQFFHVLNGLFMEALEEEGKQCLKTILQPGGDSLFSCYPTFRDFVKKCGKHGIKTIIFWDEFEHLPKDENKSHNLFADDTFFSNLRSLAVQPDNRTAFVTITKKNLKELTHQSIQSSGFWNIFATEIISLLDHHSIERLRSYGFEKIGSRLTAEEIEKIHYYSGDFPFFNQAACSFAWDAIYHHETLEWNNLDVALFPFFQKLWENRSKEEQDLLKNLKKKQEDLILKEMKARGMLVKNNDGYLPFCGYFSHLIDTKLEINRKDVLDTVNKVAETVLKVKKAVKE